ncbi:MAG: type II secretion system protein J [Planctomycetaceae bacterium]
MNRRRLRFRATDARRGLTLVEMLVATAATLVVVGVIAAVLTEFTRGVGHSRRLMELGSRLRTAASILRRDLAGATASPVPPLSPAAGMGYLEIIEGPRQDRDAADGTDELRADTDDVLLLTTSDPQRPFSGVYEDGILHSSTAEVAWFLRPSVPATVPPTYTLYRRQLLVVGRVGTAELERINRRALSGGPAAVYDHYDVSVARDLADRDAGFVTNTLADLTRRECRFLHAPWDPAVAAEFPFPFLADHQVVSLSPTADSLPAAARGLMFDADSPRRGEDVVLTGVIAFDIRVFDPAAPIDVRGTATATIAVTPGDPVALDGGIANGAYVDLGNGVYARAVSLPEGQFPRFSGYGNPLSGALVGTATTRRTYDTWSTHYEANGVDEDGVAGVDQGANGLDDEIPARSRGVASHPADGVADDRGEMETSAPYPFPLRGVEIRIRCYEPDARQVRQVTVRHAFVAP